MHEKFSTETKVWIVKIFQEVLIAQWLQLKCLIFIERYIRIKVKVCLRTLTVNQDHERQDSTINNNLII